MVEQRPTGLTDERIQLAVERARAYIGNFGVSGHKHPIQTFPYTAEWVLTEEPCRDGWYRVGSVFDTFQQRTYPVWYDPETDKVRVQRRRLKF